MLASRLFPVRGSVVLGRRLASTGATTTASVPRPAAAAVATTTADAKQKQKLVVLGSGWGGYNVARNVDKSLFDVTVVSPNSYFSFTPFLASTAVGTLDFGAAVEPVRGLKNVHFRQGWANKISTTTKTIEIEPALPPLQDDTPKDALDKYNHIQKLPDDQRMAKYTIEYDKLVVSVGCYSASFGIPGVSKYAFFLKDIKDAQAIRSRVLARLEQAVHPDITPEERKDLLQFSIVGGGPTGVEFAAELHDFVQDDVYRIMPELKGQIQIRVYDVAPGLLINFDQSLRQYAEKKFTREGIEARPNSHITAVGPDWVELDGKTKEPYGLLVWSTGLSPNPLMQDLDGFARDEKSHSIRVNEHLSALDPKFNPIPGVFAIGDNAMPVSGRLPATAQVASQMAKYTAKQLNAVANGAKLEHYPGFRWKNKGSMVLIGDHQGLLDRSAETVSGPRSVLAGFAAWLVWRSYYMTLAMGWRNKIIIPVQWMLTFFFGRDVSRF